MLCVTEICIPENEIVRLRLLKNASVVPVNGIGHSATVFLRAERPPLLRPPLVILPESRQLSFAPNHDRLENMSSSTVAAREPIVRQQQRVPPYLQAQAVRSLHHQVHEMNVRNYCQLAVRQFQPLKISFQILGPSAVSPDSGQVVNCDTTAAVRFNLSCWVKEPISEKTRCAKNKGKIYNRLKFSDNPLVLISMDTCVPQARSPCKRHEDDQNATQSFISACLFRRREWLHIRPNPPLPAPLPMVLI